MQYVVGSFARLATCLKIADVAFDHPEARRLHKWTGEYFVEVGPVTGGEIVDPSNVLPKTEQLLQKVGTDESRYAGD